MSTQRSQDIAGKFTRRTRWSGHISTLDYDVDVQLSPHLDLYAWCRGESSEPEEFEEAVRMVDLNQVDRHGWTPLMVACFHGNINACRILIEHGADANATGLRGTTPLMYAKESFLKSGRSDVFELLLAHGADPNQRDVLGLSVDAYIHQERRAIPLLQFLS